MSHIHPVDRLFESMATVMPYPAQVVAPPGRIQGLAFFPGGYGLWRKIAGQNPPPFPVEGTMVLAHNFDCESGFSKSFKAGTERATSPTWGPLTKVLTAAGIPLESCFFTNAYMGLKAGDEPLGEFPGSRDHLFVQRCADFLLKQIQEQCPRTILVLGLKAIPVLTTAVPDLAAWNRIDSLAALSLLDRQSESPIATVDFQGVGHPVRIALLVHPCNRHINARGRGFRSVTGPEAEVTLLKALFSGAS